MSKRILVPLALLVLTALTLAACGGSSDEDKITSTLETVATSSDPATCTELETQRFVEQNTTEKGKTAVDVCETEAEAGKDLAKSVRVSNVSVDGGKATATATFQGGSLDSQALEIALVEEGGDWKVDYVEGFVEYHGKALGAAFEQQFDEEEEPQLSREESSCIGSKIARLSQAEAESVIFGGAAEPIIELAQSCG